MRKWIVIAAALGVAAAATWWALRSGGGSAGVTGDALDRAAVAEAPAEGVAQLHGRERGPAKEHRLASVVFGLVRQGGRPTPARVEFRETARRARGIDAYALESLARWVDVRAAPPPLAAATAGADGRFETPIAVTGYVEALAVAPDGGLGFSFVQIPAEGAHVEVVLDVPEGSNALRGRAAYADGRPFAGKVTATSDRVTSNTLYRPAVSTDAEGRFAIEGLPIGTATVVAFLPGEMHVVWRGVPVPQEGDLVLIVDDGLLPLSGRVVDDEGGAPLAGATIVVAAWEASGGAFLLTRSGPDGGFRTSWRGRGDNAWVAAEGYAGLSFDSRNLRNPLEVRLARAASVAGRVVKASDGKPVPGARVRALSLSEGQWSSPLAETIARDDGAYVLTGLPPGDVAVVGSAPGLRSPAPLDVWHGDWSAMTVALVPGAHASKDVTLVPAAAVTGRVLDAGGAPVAGALVRLEQSTDVRTQIPTLELMEFVAASDNEGAYRLDGLPPDFPCMLTAVASGFPWAKGGPVTLRTGEAVRLDLQFDKEAVVPPAPVAVPVAPVVKRGGAPEGRPAPVPETAAFVAKVFDPSGAPIPMGQARLVAPSGGAGQPVNAGRALFDRAPEADTVLEVWGARNAYGTPLHYAPSRTPVPLGAREVDVHLMPGISVEGTVFGPDSRGIRGALVLASWPDSESDVRMNPYPWMALGGVRTDDDGRFRVGGLAEEAIVLIVIGPVGTAPLPSVATRGGARGVEIHLKAGIEPRLLVLDPDGKPIERARVSVVEVDAPPPPGMPRWTDASGVIRWESIDPTVPQRLKVEPEGRGDLVTLVVPRWMPKDETIRIPRACVVRGIVLDTARRAVAGASVEWRHDDILRGVVATDAGGRFQIGGVPEGEAITLRASMRESLARSETTVAAAVGGPEVTMTLDLGLDCRVRIEGWVKGAGGAWPYATLFEGAPSKEATHSTAAIGADGVATIPGARRDRTYTLWVPPFGDGVHVLASGLAWSDEVTSVTPTRGLPITGQVTAPSNASGVRVWVRRDGLAAPAVLGADGRYEIRGLPPGPWTVSAVWFDRGWEWRAEGAALAGGSVDLVLVKSLRRWP